MLMAARSGNAAAQGGGSVIVQSGEAYVTKEYVDPSNAKADAFCTDAVKTSCAEAKQWLTDSKDRLKQYKSDALPNTVITNDGLWAISWDMKVLLDRDSRAPGVVLTYIGNGSPYKEQMLRLAALGDRAKFTPPVVESTSWAAFNDPGGASPYFDRISPAGAASVRPDDLLKANRTVNVRPGPSGGGWRRIDVIARGETVKVLQVEIADTKYGPQEWIRFDRVKQ
jgi:hypothetical protein